MMIVLVVVLVLVLVLELYLRSKGTPAVSPQLDHERLVERFSPSLQVREKGVSYRIEDEDEYEPAGAVAPRYV